MNLTSFSAPITAFQISSPQIHVRCLDGEIHGHQLVSLQRTVIYHQPPEKKVYLAPKTWDMFMQNVSAPNFAVGVFSDKQLVGAACLVKNEWEQPLNGLNDCLAANHLLKTFKTAGVICSVMVHPWFRKRELMGRMLDVLQAQAVIAEYPVVMAQVVAKNTASFRGFVQAGFSLVGGVRDPGDGVRRFFLGCELGRGRQEIIARKVSALPASLVGRLGRHAMGQ